MRTKMAPCSTGGTDFNDLDPTLADRPSAYDGANDARLQRTEKTCDPYRVLAMARGIVPAA